MNCNRIEFDSVAISLSHVYLHTYDIFYILYRKSLKRYDVITISMGALLLATKLEEQSKILRDVRLVGVGVAGVIVIDCCIL